MTAAPDAPAPRVSDALRNVDLQQLYAWIRQPDWHNSFGREEVSAWINSRPWRLLFKVDAVIAERDAEVASLSEKLATARRDALLEAAGIADKIPMFMPIEDPKPWNIPFDQRMTSAKDVAEAIRAAAAAMKTEGA